MVEHRLAVVDPLVLLRVVPRLHAVAVLERALVGLGLLRQDPKQRRLARTVEAEDQQTLAAPDRERHVGEDRRAVEGLREALDGEHRAPTVRRLWESEAHRPLACGPL